MAGSVCADKVVAELDSISWANDSSDLIKPWIAIAKGIHDFVEASIPSVITGVTTGITTVGAIPTPSVSNANMKVTIPPGELMLPNLQTMSAGKIPGLFAAIAMWFSVPPWVIRVDSVTPPMSPVAGVSVVTFPAMISMGSSCNAVMSAQKPSDRLDAWKIIGDFIFIGMSTNLVIPVPTTGVNTIPTGPFVGVTAVPPIVWS